MIIDLTDEAFNQLTVIKVSVVRLGVTGGGCVGYEYVFKEDAPTEDDLIIDYGKFRFLVDSMSQQFIDGMKLDYVYEGLNSYFKFINPHEVSSCGCGVSVQFDV